MARTTEQTTRKSSTSTPRDATAESLAEFASPMPEQGWEDVEQYQRADGFFRLEPGAMLQGILLSTREFEDTRGERRAMGLLRLTETCESAAWYDDTGCEILGAMETGKVIALDLGRHQLRPILDWEPSRWEIFVGVKGKIKIDSGRTCWQFVIRRRPVN